MLCVLIVEGMSVVVNVMLSLMTAGSVCLCGVSSPVVVLGLFVSLS